MPVVDESLSTSYGSSRRLQLHLHRRHELQRHALRVVEEHVVARHLGVEAELLEAREDEVGELLLLRRAGDVRILGELREPAPRPVGRRRVEKDLFAALSTGLCGEHQLRKEEREHQKSLSHAAIIQCG